MTNLEIAALALALAIDAFSVAASVAPRTAPRLGALRLAASFGLFQAGMPLLGGLLGAYLTGYVSAYDHWVAFAVLEAVAARMIFEALRPQRAGTAGAAGLDPSLGLPLLGLSIATSLDAFGAGVGMRVAGADLSVASPVIGVVAAALTYAGAALGRTAKRHLGRRAEVLGGLVLVGLGLKMLRI